MITSPEFSCQTGLGCVSITTQKEVAKKSSGNSWGFIQRQRKIHKEHRLEEVEIRKRDLVSGVPCRAPEPKKGGNLTRTQQLMTEGDFKEASLLPDPTPD